MGGTGSENPAGQDEGRAVEGLEGQAKLGFPARGRRGRPVKTQGDFRGGAREAGAAVSVGAPVAVGRLALLRCPSSH